MSTESGSDQQKVLANTKTDKLGESRYLSSEICPCQNCGDMDVQRIVDVANFGWYVCKACVPIALAKRKFDLDKYNFGKPDNLSARFDICANCKKYDASYAYPFMHASWYGWHSCADCLPYLRYHREQYRKYYGCDYFEQLIESKTPITVKRSSGKLENDFHVHDIELDKIHQVMVFARNDEFTRPNCIFEFFKLNPTLTNPFAGSQTCNC